jgi:carbon monoxide dehydrogenase subunit G
MLTRAITALVVAVLVVFAGPARADDMSDMLKKGPMVRLETDKSGKFKGATCIIDVDAPIDLVWAVLIDYEKYIEFMPRMEKLEVKREGNDAYLAIKLDTPMVATKYTNKMTADAANHSIAAKQVDGDLDGSTYNWKLVSTASGGTRIFYSGLIKNFSSIAERFEDDAQTMTIGINIVSLVQAAKAIKQRAESVKAKGG